MLIINSLSVFVTQLPMENRKHPKIETGFYRSNEAPQSMIIIYSYKNIIAFWCKWVEWQFVCNTSPTASPAVSFIFDKREQNSVQCLLKVSTYHAKKIKSKLTCLRKRHGTCMEFVNYGILIIIIIKIQNLFDSITGKACLCF